MDRDWYMVQEVGFSKDGILPNISVQFGRALLLWGTEVMIRYRIVVGLQNGRLAENLQQHTELTLEKAVNQARQSEAVKNQ